MNSKKRINLRHMALTATGAATVSLSLFAASPGLAAVDDGTCNAGEFCAWQHADMNSIIGEWTGDDLYWGYPANDAATSLWNNGMYCNIRFYENQGGGGYYGDLARGASYNQLASWWIVWPTYNFDNRISGHKWICP